MRWCLLFSVWLVPNVLSKGGRFIHRLLINLILKKYLCKAFHNCFFPSLPYISNCYFVTGVTPSKVWFDHLIYLFTEVLLNLIWCARAHTHTHTTLPLVEELVKWTKHFRIVSVASGESGLLCKGMQSILWPSFLFLLQKENNLDMIAEVAFYDETSSIHSTRYAVSLIL